MLLEIGNRHGLVGVDVVVMVEHLYERPLGPFIVVGVAGTYLAVPVETETYVVELLTVACYVFTCCNFGMLTRLDGILLGRKSVGVVAHRMEHIESTQTFVAGEYVGCNIAERMAHMQPGSGGIREHIEHIEFRLGAVCFRAVGFILFPSLLPALFYLFMTVFHLFLSGFIRIYRENYRD